MSDWLEAQWRLWLVPVNTLIGVTLIALVATAIAVVVHYYRKVRDMHEEAMLTLAVVKGWAEVARSAHKDTQAVVKEVKPAIGTIPERTAEKVVERLSESGGK